MGFDNKFSNKILELTMTFKHIWRQTLMDGYAYKTEFAKMGADVVKSSAVLLSTFVLD